MISHALNLVQDEYLTEAADRLAAWAPLDHKSPSTIERLVRSNVRGKLGRVLRYQGHFSKALEHLQKCYDENENQALCKASKASSDLVYELADTLTELGRTAESREFVQRELRRLGEEGRLITAASTVLNLSLTETFLYEGEVKEAESIYLNLASSRMGHFVELQWRVGLARIAHLKSQWSDARDHWIQALHLLNTYFPRGKHHSGYTSLAILRSMHHALRKSLDGDLNADRDQINSLCDKTREQVQEIEATCALDGCRCWVPGLNSYWIAVVR